MVRWTSLAPWEFESPFPGSLTSTFPEPQTLDQVGQRMEEAGVAVREVQREEEDLQVPIRGGG